ncbi:hypothetical protein FA13DRAFT_1794180 [Coprinellus micaceus]|uniref:Uncharacterized protein n=1 Tax=Coprinellus micaceus TaxID=71717 RepID=A0A4Y7T2K8_COPMI|nr:hypothetical protein FA13DRAFT_1794180 [Coprinellus micaceus]
MAPPKGTKSTKAETGTERLDVEDDEARQKRLQSLLEHLSTPTSNPAATVPALPAPPTGLPKFDFGDRRTEAVVPNTELLSRVQAFLPQLEASNRELLARAKADPKSVDIENLENKDRDGRVIKLNLGLGVFEEKQGRSSAKQAAPRPAGSKAGEGDEAMDPSSSSSSSSDDSDSDSSEDSSSDSTSDSDSDSSSSSQAEDEGPNDPLTNFFASLGSALDSATTSSPPHLGSDSEDSDGDGDDDEDPLTSFFDSLRYGQTISMDSSDEEEEEVGEEGDSDEDEEGGQRRKEEKEKREVKPLPKRARPRIEVIRDEAPSGVDDGVNMTAGWDES